MRAMSISHQARASLGPKLIESRPSGNTNLVPGGTVKTSASDTRSSPGAPKPCNKMTTGPLPPPCPSVPPVIRTSNPPTLSRRMCRTVHQCPPPWASQLAENLRKSALSEKLLGDDFEDGVSVGDVDVAIGAEHETQKTSLPAVIGDAGGAELRQIYPAQDYSTNLPSVKVHKEKV